MKNRSSDHKAFPMKNSPSHYFLDQDLDKDDMSQYMKSSSLSRNSLTILILTLIPLISQGVAKQSTKTNVYPLS